LATTPNYSHSLQTTTPLGIGAVALS